MPIRINLLAEAIAEEELRRRDPVKRAIYIGAFLVVLSFVWFSSSWLVSMEAKHSLNEVQSAVQTHSNEWVQVQMNLGKVADTQKRLDALQKLSNARFLQGNLMNALQHLYVPNVQLTRVKVDQNYTLNAGSPAAKKDSATIPAQPATSTERIILTLDAKDFSANAGDGMNRFKNALLKQDYFSATLDPTNGVRLASVSPPQSSYDSKPYVLFTLECRFTDKTR
jgi:hypothetical protein